MLLGSMQDWPLRVGRLIDHAAREHGHRAIVSRWADGRETQTTWGQVRVDALKLARALREAGIGAGDRVATLAMNHAAHLVAWYGVPGAGAVLHTLNPRLFDDQLAYIVNHAQDRVLLFDAAFAPLVERMKPHWPSIEHYVCFDSAGPAPLFADWIEGGGRRLGRGRRARGLHAQLYQRHDRRSQGRALFAPLDRASCFRCASAADFRA
jgi:fatty-acyl-CoA synthase